jgi:dihydroceramidase
VVAALVTVFVVGVVLVELRGEQAHVSAAAATEKPYYTHTASIDFCEANYAVLSFVVELQNTLSSLAICGIALYALFMLPPDFRLVCVALCVTGLGSVLFHATMSRAGQALDEVGMLVVVVLLMWHMFRQRYARRLAALLALSVAAYCLSPNPALFQSMFIGCIVVVTVHTIRSFERSGPLARGHMMTAFYAFASGASLWLAEPVVCPHSPVSLHALWHVLSSLGCYYWLRYAVVTEDSVIS